MLSADCCARSTTRSSDEGSPSHGTGVGTEGTYEVDSELRFGYHDLVLMPTASAVPGLTFRLDVQSWTGTDTDDVFVTVSGDAFDRIGDALRADRTVDDYRLVADFETERLYRVHVAQGAKRLRSLFDGVAAVVRDARCTGEGWTVRAHLSTRTVLTDLTGACQDADVSMEVLRLSCMETVADPDGAVLNADQRELLAAAIDHGYFETPRGISQNDLARMFDVSPSAISQRLRTATGKLVAHNLAVQ